MSIRAQYEIWTQFVRITMPKTVYGEHVGTYFEMLENMLRKESARIDVRAAVRMYASVEFAQRWLPF